MNKEDIISIISANLQVSISRRRILEIVLKKDEKEEFKIVCWSLGKRVFIANNIGIPKTQSSEIFNITTTDPSKWAEDGLDFFDQVFSPEERLLFTACFKIRIISDLTISVDGKCLCVIG